SRLPGAGENRGAQRFAAAQSERQDRPQAAVRRIPNALRAARQSMSAARAPLPHARPRFAVADGELTIGGIALSRLAARVGQTPFYAYERAALAARVKQLRAALPPQIELHYAMKANPMPALVDFMASQVDGLDVASGRELRVALDSGMNPD